MTLFDTHAHLTDDILATDLDNIADSLISEGVGNVVEIGFDVESSIEAIKLANRYANIYAAVGIHPQASESTHDADYYRIMELSKEDKVVAIGEIGLDYHYDYDKTAQKSVFIRQIEIANELKLPIIIHLRDAYEEMEDILKRYASIINCGILFHCYSGSREMMKRFEFLDPYYAFGGAITFKNANKGDIVRAVPIESLLLETDCPYMTPVPFRGKPNSPLYLKYTASKMAELLEMDVEKIAEITTANAKRFFSIK